MNKKAHNQMMVLLKRVNNILRMVGLVIDGAPDESADKLFATFLLTELAQERGLLGNNCNRAVVTALHAIGLEENDTPLYLQKKEA